MNGTPALAKPFTHLFTLLYISKSSLLLLLALSMPAWTSAQPANDDACNATALTLGTACSGFPYTNVDATAQAGEQEGSCFFGNASNLQSVWFTFVAPASGRVRIHTEDGGGISQLQIQYSIYAATNCSDFGTFTELACFVNSFEEDKVVAGLTEGTTYYIQFDVTNTNQGTFCMEVYDCPPPTNDQPCSATALTLGVSCAGFPYSNQCAVSDPNEPLGSCFFGSSAQTLESLWFSFVAPPSERVRIHAEDGNGLSQLQLQYAVYAVTNCGDYNTFTQLACSVNTFNEDRILGGLTNGTTYYIQFDGTNENDGTFCIEVSDCPAPANDDACNATPLTLGAACTVPYSNDCAIGQANEPYPDCWFGNSSSLNSVWFSFVAPPSGRVKIERISGSLSIGNIDFAVYSATDCSDFSTYNELSCLGNDLQIHLTLEVTPGETYYIQVDGENDDIGTFCVEVSDCPAPTNDNVCNAVPITLGATCTGNYAVDCGLPQTNEPIPSCWFSDIPPSLNTVWFSFVAPSSGRVTIRRISGSLSITNMNFAVYAGSDCSDFTTFTELICLGNTFLGGTTADEVILDVAPGVTHYIQIDGENDDLGTFCLEVFDCPPPVNDDVCNATELTANATCTNNQYSNECALPQPFEQEGSCYFGNTNGLNSVWFEFTATANGAYFTTDIQPYGTLMGDLQMALFSATDCNNFGTFGELSCDRDFNPVFIDQTGLTQGTTYYLQVDGQFFDRGDFCLEVWAPVLTCPANLTAQCNISEQPVYADLAAFEAAGGTAVSNNGINAASFQLVSESSDGLSCAETVTRVYSITDDKSYTSSCTQVITVDDTIDPELQGTPTMTVLNLQCAGDVPTPPSPTATDNCDQMVDVAFNESTVPGSCSNQFTLTRTWTATDDCSNTDVFVQTIDVNDDVSPTFDCPADAILDCSLTPPAAYTDLSSFLNAGGEAFDLCGLNTGSFQLFSTSGSEFACPGTLTRTYRITDTCGNPSTCNQTFNFVDLQGCDDTNLFVNAMPLPYQQYRAENIIQSAGLVANGTSVEFRAGQSATLNADFEVELGGVLTILIENCNQN